LGCLEDMTVLSVLASMFVRFNSSYFCWSQKT